MSYGALDFCSRSSSLMRPHPRRRRTVMSDPSPPRSLLRRHEPTAALSMRPERWATWLPNKGDILVCTPSKFAARPGRRRSLLCLFTAERTCLRSCRSCRPGRRNTRVFPASDVAAALAAQTGRRVVKTHTPGRWLPDLGWRDGHCCISPSPRRFFLSLHKHTANRTNPGDLHPMSQPVSRAIRTFINNPWDNTNDEDTLTKL